MVRTRSVLAALTLGLALAVPGVATAADVELRVLSGRADLVTGGDALIEVRLPRGADADALRVRAGSRDVTHALRASGARRRVGLVSGLPAGRTVLTARVGDEQGARLTVRNGSTAGPLIAGPRIQPWRCTTRENGLGDPVDDGCSAAGPVTEHWYRSTRSGRFERVDPAAPPPADAIARTTTDVGRTVPYVVRVERGTVARSIYATAVLADPATPDGSAWNGKLMIPFGGSCAARFRQSPPAAIEVSQAAPDGAVLLHRQLSRGYAVATAGALTLGQNCNTAVSAETVMLLKERVAEALGDPIRFTVSAGCSGGSLQQHVLADAYPGLLDGLLPSCSFPDLWSPVRELTDCTLLGRYFTQTAPLLWLDPLARQAVSGFATPANCPVFDLAFANVLDASGNEDLTTACDVPDGEIYDARTNPRGVRCAVQDYQRAVWGVGDDGRALRPLDNVGVQYGLAALESGRISPAQFVDLNARIGGLDLDGAPSVQRMRADPRAVERAYASGQIVRGRGLADAAIIDLRGTGNLEVHTDHWSYATRARLRAANGTAANQVIWTSATDGFLTIGLEPPSSPAPDAFAAMDSWLEAVEDDDRDVPRSVKVRENRPARAVDACFAPGRNLDPATCRALFPVFSNPRMVAGEGTANDTVKCRLQPLRRGDYRVAFTDEEWARLRGAFPDGVCDWRREAAGRVEPVPAPTFAGGPGGRPLPATPRSTAFGVDGTRLGLPPRSRCIRGGRLRVAIPAFARVARFSVRGRTVARRRVRPGVRRVVTLRGLPRGTVRLRSTVDTRGGRRLTSARRYRGCGT